ncbi:MAG TPA: hypothetical protein VJB59_10510 [Bdellovibrionota bacterium]|nr:hypothetical protein [Bdellovibrionota bacterium]
MTATSTAQPATETKANLSRRRLRTEGRKKRALKLKTDKEFAKKFFEAKSKRSTDKKSAFRKKKMRKK